MAFANRNLINCFACNRNYARQGMRRIWENDNLQARRIAIDRRNKYQRDHVIGDNTRICLNCHRSILQEIVDMQNLQSIKLDVLMQTRNNSCFICNAVNNVHMLSTQCKVNAFIESGIFYPEHVRSCRQHLDDRGFVLPILYAGIQSVDRFCVVRGSYMGALLNCIPEVSQKKKRIQDEYEFTEEELLKLTSFTLDQFNHLLVYCDPVPVPGGHRYVHRKDLLLFLCKLRQGLSDKFLRVIFNYSSRQSTSMAISTVRQSLILRFVPENLGLGGITRQQYIHRHVTEFSNILYNPEPEIPKAIVYIDTTYAYTYKSMNSRVLRQSYCRHKGRHLVKPSLLVAPDGYILDVQGPYFSDSQNNDAAIIRNEIDNDEMFNDWSQEGDIVVIDRGYRDALQMLHDLGLITKMPPLLNAGEQQLTTEDANEARKVTKTRWIVESRNGHIKQKFKLLNMIQQTHVLPNVGDYYRIGSAIINRCHPLIHMDGADAEMARLINERALRRNWIQIRVENENLAARNAQRWVMLDAEELQDFPVLTIEFLEDLTVGVYQIGLAPSYVQDKIQREEGDVFEIEMLIGQNVLPEPGFLRARIFSRFRNRARYSLWISNIPYGDLLNEPIRGYYCTCKTRARTLGTCARTTSVLWYLGFAKNQEYVHYPSQILLDTIDDAGNKPAQVNPN